MSCGSSVSCARSCCDAHEHRIPAGPPRTAAAGLHGKHLISAPDQQGHGRPPEADYLVRTRACFKRRKAVLLEETQTTKGPTMSFLTSRCKPTVYAEGDALERTRRVGAVQSSFSFQSSLRISSGRYTALVERAGLKSEVHMVELVLCHVLTVLVGMGCMGTRELPSVTNCVIVVILQRSETLFCLHLN